MLSNIYSVESISNTVYHGLQVTGEKRMGHHVGVKGFYTFSKAMEDVQLENNTVNGNARTSTTWPWTAAVRTSTAATAPSLRSSGT